MDRDNYVINCKTFEKLIPDFLADRLDNDMAEAFIAHLEGCENCREELSIQYLVYAGLPKLETGETFNLNNELISKIESERNHVIRRKKLTNLAYSMEMITICAVIASFVLLAIFA